MGTLYLLGRSPAEIALDLAAGDPSAVVVLLLDGVLLDAERLHAAGRAVHVLASHAQQRGQATRLPRFVRPIDHGELVDLIAAHKVVSLT